MLTKPLFGLVIIEFTWLRDLPPFLLPFLRNFSCFMWKFSFVCQNDILLVGCWLLENPHSPFLLPDQLGTRRKIKVMILLVIQKSLRRRFLFWTRLKAETSKFTHSSKNFFRWASLPGPLCNITYFLSWSVSERGKHFHSNVPKWRFGNEINPQLIKHCIVSMKFFRVLRLQVLLFSFFQSDS